MVGLFLTTFFVVICRMMGDDIKNFTNFSDEQKFITMRKTLIILVLAAISVFASAQQVTTFIGIPVDGTKQEMIKALRDKGFTYDVYTEEFTGEFNGEIVNISIQTVSGKVWRLIISDASFRNERQIKNRFNTLCDQFANNGRYVIYAASEIPENEDISEEIILNEKEYSAGMVQRDSEGFDEFVQATVYNDEWWKSLSREELQFLELDDATYNKLKESNIVNALEEFKKQSPEEYNDLFTLMEMTYNVNRLVWFKIQGNGPYKIVMYYENNYNSAQGQDL